MIDALSHEGRQLFAKHSITKHFPLRKTILRRGDPIDGAYVVLTGSLRAYALSTEGQQSTLYSVGPGEACLFAVNCLFTVCPYPAWVEAAPGTSIAWVQGQAFRSLFSSEVAIQALVIRALSAAVSRLMATIEEVASEPLRVRVARHILNNSDETGFMKSTQQEIASQLGVSREAVGREVSRLARAHILVTGRGYVRISDQRRLAAQGDLVVPAS